MVDRIHVIDPDILRRVQLSREMRSLNIDAETYENVEDFCRRSPHDGFVFATAGAGSLDPSDLVETIRMNGCALPVVIYAEEPGTESVVSAMRSGAIDYLEWPFDPRRLSSTFRHLDVDGNRKRQDEGHRSSALAKINRLTKREREVLVQLILGMSSKEMARVLQVSPRTVEIHRGNMMAKLDARSAADAVRIGLYAGLDTDFRVAA